MTRLLLYFIAWGFCLSLAGCFFVAVLQCDEDGTWREFLAHLRVWYADARNRRMVVHASVFGGLVAAGCAFGVALALEVLR